MAQSKNCGFGEDEMMLRDSARKFFSDNCSPDKLHAQVASNSDPHRPRDPYAYGDSDSHCSVLRNDDRDSDSDGQCPTLSSRTANP